MADNFDANPGVGGDTFAADEIGGVKYPRSKAGFGVDGAYVDVSASDPLPVVAIGGPTETKQDTGNTSLASIDAKLPALLTTIPENDVAAPPVRPVGEDIWNVSFSDVGSVLAPEFTLRRSGTGIGQTQASGALLVTSGTTANAEWLARSIRSWQGSLCLRFSTVLSQRIANNNFHVMLADLVGEGLTCTINSTTSISVAKVGHGLSAVNVGQFMMVGAVNGAAGVPGRFAIASIPDADTINFTVAGWPASGSCTVDLFGHSYCRVLYTSTTATNAAFDTQRRGWANGDTTATVNTTASPGHVAQVHLDGRNAFLADTLRASSTTPAVVVRSSKIENMPDDNLDLYLFLWCQNGTTNPATTTTWTCSFLSVEKFANTPVYVQGQRMQGAAAAAPVAVVGSPAVTVTSGAITATGITGTVAHDGIGTSNPVRIAGRASNAAVAPVSTTGDTCDIATTMSGALTQKPYAIPEQDWTYPAAAGGIANTTTAITIKAAGGAGLRNYITGIDYYSDALGAASELVIRDGAAGTVLWRTFLPAAGTPAKSITFATPLRGTAATLLEVCTLTASVTGAVFFNAQGYTAA